MGWTERDRAREQLAGFPRRMKEMIGMAEGTERQVKAFARRCGLGVGTVRRYLMGTRLPTLDRLFMLALAGEVSVAWLATGVGEPETDSGTGGNLDLELVRNTIISVDTRLGTRIPPEEKANLVVDLVNAVHGRLGLSDAEKRGLLQEVLDSREEDEAEDEADTDSDTDSDADTPDDRDDGQEARPKT